MRSKDSIDVTGRKPRRFKGTPAYSIRNYVIYTVLAYTLATGVCLWFSPLTRNLGHKFQVLGEARKYELEESTDEEKYRQSRMLSTFSTLILKEKVAERFEEKDDKTV